MADTIRDLRKVPWAQVESELLRDPRITPQCKALYSLLITYGPRRIFPSQQTLGDCLGVTRQTVKAWLDQLRDLGLITWRASNGSSNEYDILGYANLRAEPVKPTLHPCKAQLTPPVKQALHDLEPSNQNQEHIPAIAEKKEAATAELADYEDLAVMCPECDEPVILAQVSKSACICPTCSIPLWIIGPREEKLYKPPQRYRTAGGDGWIDLPVKGWCALSGKDYKAMSYPTKRKLANEFRDAAGKATPEQVYDALKQFTARHPYWTYWDWPSDKFLGILGQDLTAPAPIPKEPEIDESKLVLPEFMR